MLLISLNDLCHYSIVITGISLLAAFSLTFIHSITPEHSSVTRMLKCRSKSYYNDESKTSIPTDKYFFIFLQMIQSV